MRAPLMISSISIALLLAIAAREVEAKPRAAMLEFRGWKAGRARTAARSGVQRVVQLVPKRDVEMAVRVLGENPYTPLSVARLAAALDVPIVVEGSIIGDGAASMAQIQIFARDGRRLAKWNGQGPASRVMEEEIAAGAREAVKEALKKLDNEPAVEMIASSDEPQPAPEAPRVTRYEPSLQASKPLPKDEEEPATAIEKPRPQPLPVGRSVVVPKDELVEPESNAHTLSALAGVTIRRRAARVELDDGRTAKHDTGAFPELTVVARTRPFARTPGALAGVFADLEGAFAIGLSAKGSSEDEPADVSSSAHHLRFSAGWCWEQSGFAAGASVGFGIEGFALGENALVGSASYTFVRPGIVGRAEIAGESLAAEVDAGWRAVLAAGDLGAPYEQNVSAGGFDATARLTGTIEVGIPVTYALQGSWVRYTLSFAEPRELPADTEPLALSGSDTSLSATLVLGIALR